MSAPDQAAPSDDATASAGGPIVPSHVPGGANAPRGLRNNNAGNLKALGGGQAWNGQVGQDKDGYLQFATPQDGVRAALISLQAKQNLHGLNTVAGIIAAPHVGWDPGNSTYAKYVAQRLGVDPNAPINVTDPNTAKGLLNAIFAFENGPSIRRASASIGGGGAHRPEIVGSVVNGYCRSPRTDARLAASYTTNWPPAQFEEAPVPCSR